MPKRGSENFSKNKGAAPGVGKTVRGMVKRSMQDQAGGPVRHSDVRKTAKPTVSLVKSAVQSLKAKHKKEL